jgi:regulator of protease activity HflC (stomatin/prohibitin superfamily)
MDMALGWIGDLVRWLAQFVPRLAHIRANERGIKFVRARTAGMAPGLHVYWPITSQVDIYPVKRQVLRISPMNLTTQDGRTVTAGGAVAYEIEDLHVFLVDNYQAEDSITDLAALAVQRTVEGRKYDALRQGGAALNAKITREARNHLTPLGVKVEYARLTDFAPTNVLSIVGANRTDRAPGPAVLE